MKDIWIIGDSVGAGIVLNEKGRYGFSGQALCARLQSCGYDVHRLAQMGATAEHALAHAARIPDGSCGLALVSLGGNDCDFNWTQVAKSPEEEHISGTPLARFSKAVQELFANLRARGVEPYALIPPPIDSKRYFHTITKRGADARGVMKFLGHLTRISEWQERYALAFAAATAQSGCQLIDVRGAFLHTKDFRTLIGQDGIHPNDSGYALLSDTVVPFVQASGCAL